MSAALLARLEALHPVEDFYFLDVETYWGPKYGLKQLGIIDYVRDPKFQVIGWGVKHNASPAVWMTPEEFAAWVPTVNWSKAAVAAHNCPWDGFVLTEKYGIRPSFWVDTLSMAREIHGVDVGGSLDFLAEKFDLGKKGKDTKWTYGKRREEFTPDEMRRFAAYCVNDVELMYALYPRLASQIPELEMYLIDLTMRCRFNPCLTVDEPLLLQLVESEQQKKAEILARVAKDKTQLASNDQFAALLEDLGVTPPQKLSPAGLKKNPPVEKWTWAFSKSDSGMKALLEHEDLVVRTLAEARLKVKSTINETRASRFIDLGRAGPLPVSLTFHGAHTGRWSGGGGDRTNFQNLERTDKRDEEKGVIRKAIIPADPGNTLVVVDSGQIEVRVLAWLAEHEFLLETFRKNDALGDEGDFYSEAGSPLLGKKLTKSDPERQVAKGLLLGLGFQMGWRRCSVELLRGLLGTPPKQFTEADAEKYEVDLARFRMDDNAMDDIAAMPSRLPLEARVTHCAVTAYFVDKYRSVNTPIVDFWHDMEKVLKAMVEGEEASFGPGGCVRVQREAIVLPSGRSLNYPDLRYKAGKWGEKGAGFSYKGRKHRERIYGGLLTENVVQAVARDVVAEQLLWIKALHRYPVATMTHDEGVFVVKEALGEEAFGHAMGRLRVPPEWAVGLPLSASGGWGKSYGAVK